MIWIILITSLLSSSVNSLALSAETDAFSTRLFPLADGIPQINAEIQTRIEASIQEINLLSQASPTLGSCDWKQFDQIVGSRLRQPFLGQIESWVNQSLNIPKQNPQLSGSIYRNIPKRFGVPLQIGIQLGIGMASHIQHNGLLIGTDKFGHFFDEGYYYYYLVHTLGKTIPEAVEFGNLLEQTIDGSWFSGIYSYADLAANYDGYRFWRDLLGTPENRNQTKWVACLQGKWMIKEKFEIGWYLSPAWDEAMNCSTFRTPDLAQSVAHEIERLEKKSGLNLKCPIYPSLVPMMKQRYGDFATQILHPSVRNQ